MHMKESSKKTDKKRIYSFTKNMICPRCGIVTAHSLFDADKGIYKCLLCKTIHAK